MSRADELRRARTAFLKALYDIGGGDITKYVPTPVVLERSGVDPDDLHAVYAALIEAGYIDETDVALTDMVITWPGVQAVERAEQHPERTIGELAPMNVVINHGTMTGLQQGGANVQNIQVGSLDVAQMRDAVSQLRSALPEFESEDRGFAEAQIATLEVQVHSGKPHRPVVAAAIEGLKAIGYNMVASGALEALTRILG